jgi:hypothetical protein
MRIQILLRVTTALVALAGGLVEAAPMGTAFYYQGRLSEGATPVAGLYDFRFELFDAATGGTKSGQRHQPLFH